MTDEAKKPSVANAAKDLRDAALNKVGEAAGEVSAVAAEIVGDVKFRAGRAADQVGKTFGDAAEGAKQAKETVLDALAGVSGRFTGWLKRPRGGDQGPQEPQA